jgi:glycosyltransferase involved in cell wall biosynthesis
MKKISVAIPFYNASKFIEDAIRIPLFDDRVDEIIINDDCSTEEEFKNLLKIIDNLKNNNTISYDISQNFIHANHKNFVHINNEMTSKNVKEFVDKIVRELGSLLNRFYKQNDIDLILR